MKKETCCFMGHEIGEELNAAWLMHPHFRQKLISHLVLCIEVKIREGYTTFLCPMYKGCCLLFANLVLGLRQLYPQVSLVAVLPYPDHAEEWVGLKKRIYERILSECDRKVNLVKRRDRYNFLVMTQYLLSKASYVVGVYSGRGGDTGYFIKCALDKKIPLKIFGVREKNLPEKYRGSYLIDLKLNDEGMVDIYLKPYKK